MEVALPDAHYLRLTLQSSKARRMDDASAVAFVGIPYVVWSRRVCVEAACLKE